MMMGKSTIMNRGVPKQIQKKYNNDYVVVVSIDAELLLDRNTDT
jgi:hypothetical protein